MSITREIFDTVVEALEGAGPGLVVKSINLKIGRMTAVSPDCVRLYFEMLSEDTPLSSAALNIEILPIIAVCGDCGANFESEEPVIICPECSSMNADMIQGRELLVDSIEVEDGKE